MTFLGLVVPNIKLANVNTTSKLITQTVPHIQTQKIVFMKCQKICKFSVKTKVKTQNIIGGYRSHCHTNFVVFNNISLY